MTISWKSTRLLKSITFQNTSCGKTRNLFLASFKNGISFISTSVDYLRSVFIKYIFRTMNVKYYFFIWWIVCLLYGRQVIFRWHSPLVFSEIGKNVGSPKLTRPSLSPPSTPRDSLAPPPCPEVWYKGCIYNLEGWYWNITSKYRSAMLQ